MKARISGVAAYLPERTLTSGDVERRIEGYAPHRGVIERMTGIRRRHVAGEDEQASDLAVAAVHRLGLGLADLHAIARLPARGVLIPTYRHLWVRSTRRARGCARGPDDTPRPGTGGAG